MYNSLYETINNFETRGKRVIFNEEKLTLNVFDSQSDTTFEVKIIKENKLDLYKSLIELI